MDRALLKDYFPREQEYDEDSDDDAPPPPRRKPPRPLLGPPLAISDDYDLLPAESITSDDTILADSDDEDAPPPPRRKPPRPSKPPPLPTIQQATYSSHQPLTPFEAIMRECLQESGVRYNVVIDKMWYNSRTPQHAWDLFCNTLAEKISFMEECLSQLNTSKSLKIMAEDKRRYGYGLGAWKNTFRLHQPQLIIMAQNLLSQRGNIPQARPTFYLFQ